MRSWLDIEQNTEEWLALRMGRFTASSFADLMGAKSNVGYKKAINNVVFELLTGKSPEGFSSEWMQRGHELEPIAREEYEMLTFNTVTDGGFYKYGEYIGASPDGNIDSDGLLEIKCPAPHTMIDYLSANKLPSTYRWQVQGQLFVSGRQYVDFFAYHPDLKPLLIKCYPVEADQEALRIALDEAIVEMKAKLNSIKSLK